MQYCDRLRYCTAHCINDIPIKNISVIHSLLDVICYKSIFNMPSSHILGIRVGYKLQKADYCEYKAGSLKKEKCRSLHLSSFSGHVRIQKVLSEGVQLWRFFFFFFVFFLVDKGRDGSKYH